MKVLFAIGTLGDGGAERVVANLSSQFARDGHEVSILTIYSSLKDYEIDGRVTLHHTDAQASFRGFRGIRRIQSIRKITRDIRPDVVISFLADVNIYVILSLLGLGLKLVVSERNDPSRDPHQGWMRLLRNKLYPHTNGVVFQTEEAQRYFDGMLPSRVSTAVIPNPLDGNLPGYQPEAASCEFIVASRLNEQKNLPMILEAMRLLTPDCPACKVKIFGEGPQKEHLLELIKRYRLEDTVTLEGYTRQIHQHMQKASALIISSDYEGISNSMLEALGIGLPVISTDCPVGGARMFITHGVNGYLIPCGDATGLADAMKLIAADHSVADRHLENARAIRDRLSITTITRQWYDFLKQYV